MLDFRQFISENESRRWGKVASGLVVFYPKDDQVLWTKRSQFVNEPKTWALTIGGKVEEGESPLLAAKREFKEETGIDPDKSLDVERSPIFVYNESSFHYYTFFATTQRRFRIPDFSNKRGQGQWEILDYSWGSLSEMPAPLHFSVNANFINQLQKKIQRFS